MLLLSFGEKRLLLRHRVLFVLVSVSIECAREVEGEGGTAPALLPHPQTELCKRPGAVPSSPGGEKAKGAGNLLDFRASIARNAIWALSVKRTWGLGRIGIVRGCATTQDAGSREEITEDEGGARRNHRRCRRAPHCAAVIFDTVFNLGFNAAIQVGDLKCQ